MTIYIQDVACLPLVFSLGLPVASHEAAHTITTSERSRVEVNICVYN